MNCYLVGYELKKTQDLARLNEQMQLWGGIRLRPTLWLVEVAGTAKTVRDAFHAAVSKEDGVFVLQLKPGIEWSSWDIPIAASDWLAKKFPKPF